MLTKLVIRNFQKNKKRVLHLKRGINCIVGDNGAGKSSIVRALRWLALNTPKGSGFIHHDEQEAQVKVWTNEHRIIRLRGKSLNKYQLDDQEFVAFGDSVPEPIQRALGMRAVHFQGQLDPLYWVSLKPTALSEEIRQVVDLDVFARCVEYFKADQRKKATEVKAYELIIDEASEEINQGRRIQALHDELTQLDSLYARLDSIDSKIADVEKAAERLESYGGDYNRLEALASHIEALMTNQEELGRLTTSINRVEGLRDSIQEQQAELKMLEAEAATYSICSTCGGRYRDIKDSKAKQEKGARTHRHG